MSACHAMPRHATHAMTRTSMRSAIQGFLAMAASRHCRAHTRVSTPSHVSHTYIYMCHNRAITAQPPHIKPKTPILLKMRVPQLYRLAPLHSIRIARRPSVLLPSDNNIQSFRRSPIKAWLMHHTCITARTHISKSGRKVMEKRHATWCRTLRAKSEV